MSESFATPETRSLGLPRLLCPWGFSGKNIGVGCHFLLQGNLPDPRIKPTSPVSPALQADSLPLEPLRKPNTVLLITKY